MELPFFYFFVFVEIQEICFLVLETILGENDKHQVLNSSNRCLLMFDKNWSSLCSLSVGQSVCQSVWRGGLPL